MGGNEERASEIFLVASKGLRRSPLGSLLFFNPFSGPAHVRMSMEMELVSVCDKQNRLAEERRYWFWQKISDLKRFLRPLPLCVSPSIRK